MNSSKFNSTRLTLTHTAAFGRVQTFYTLRRKQAGSELRFSCEEVLLLFVELKQAISLIGLWPTSNAELEHVIEAIAGASQIFAKNPRCQSLSAWKNTGSFSKFSAWRGVVERSRRLQASNELGASKFMSWG
jgi:hypothetical protein